MSVPYSEGKNDAMLLERSARARSGIWRSMVARPKADTTVSNPSVYHTSVRIWHNEQQGRGQLKVGIAVEGDYELLVSVKCKLRTTVKR